jgi:two-component SAPR family response regulator
MVLLVEDEAAVRNLAAPSSQPPRLVISDIVMPDMGGRQLAKQLREQHPELRILLCRATRNTAWSSVPNFIGYLWACQSSPALMVRAQPWHGDRTFSSP